MRNACLYTPWALEQETDNGFVRGTCFGGEGGPAGGPSGGGRSSGLDSASSISDPNPVDPDNPGAAPTGQGGGTSGIGGQGGGGRAGSGASVGAGVGGASPQGVTINVNPQLVAPGTEEPTTVRDRGPDTTEGLGGGQPSGRRRARSGTLLTLGLAETTRKTLLGQ